ncbi:MAG: glycosyl transferase [Ignavibacteriaceae bacterium]|nr:glycosyl transferase [Ignavibacteriaceae bacterium]
MYNFCTLFDTHYLTRGLALYYSLKNNCDNYHLYIFAFNDKCYEILEKLNLENVTLIPLSEFESPELLKVKPTRSIAEYCWTCTSSTILYVLEKFNVESCTYLDSDMCFYSSPQPIFNELGSDSILITEHRYSPKYNKEIRAGKYCVQFVTFRNNEYGLKALKWWKDRCIEWCYAKYEDGKFGDQLYLNDWLERFERVHVLQHLGGGLAAWNVQQYKFSEENGKIVGTEESTGKKFDAIFYHFHYLRFFNNGEIELGRRILTENIFSTFYRPYIRYLDEIKLKVETINNSFDPHGSTTKPLNWKAPILYIYRNLKGVYNIFDKQKFLES